MLGAEIPDLETTPCPVCEARVEGPVVWDPWYPTDLRVAAMPMHPACAADALPPSQPSEAMKRCGLCELPFEAQVLSEAFAALHRRFETAAGERSQPTVVWRLAGREPRVFVGEHFACVLKKAGL